MLCLSRGGVQLSKQAGGMGRRGIPLLAGAVPALLPGRSVQLTQL